MRTRYRHRVTDPSVSPGVGGEVRQRLFPKPGIPHFRIKFDDSGIPYAQGLNMEALEYILQRYRERYDLLRP